MPTENQKEKLDARLKDMEQKATALEEQADYAVKEAELHKRIVEAKNRIAANKQRGLSLPNFLSGTNRFAIGLLILAFIILLITKAC